MSFIFFRGTTETDYFSQGTPPNAAAAANFGHAAADFGKTRRRTPLPIGVQTLALTTITWSIRAFYEDQADGDKESTRFM